MNNEVGSAMHVGDFLSLGVLIGYFVGALPIIATLLTIIWTGIRIYEMDTIQRLLGKKKNGTSID